MIVAVHKRLLKRLKIIFKNLLLSGKLSISPLRFWVLVDLILFHDKKTVMQQKLLTDLYLSSYQQNRLTQRSPTLVLVAHCPSHFHHFPAKPQPDSEYLQVWESSKCFLRCFLKYYISVQCAEAGKYLKHARQWTTRNWLGSSGLTVQQSRLRKFGIGSRKPVYHKFVPLKGQTCVKYLCCWDTWIKHVYPAAGAKHNHHHLH